MKHSGRTIKQRLYGLTKLPGMFARARYFRGHGVHSPYIYSIVRHVFMKSKLSDSNQELYDKLLSIAIPKRRAVELQNLFHHCNYKSFALDESVKCDMLILTELTSDNETITLVNEASKNRGTVIVMYPHSCRERSQLCESLIESHSSTTVDNRCYLIIFNNHLPKQHFKL